MKVSVIGILIGLFFGACLVYVLLDRIPTTLEMILGTVGGVLGMKFSLRKKS
jgi:hypothetical protein